MYIIATCKYAGCIVLMTFIYTGLYFLKSYCLVLKANNILKVVSVVAQSWFEWKIKFFLYFISSLILLTTFLTCKHRKKNPYISIYPGERGDLVVRYLTPEREVGAVLCP